MHEVLNMTAGLSLLSLITAIISLLFAAAVAAMAFKRFKFPYTIGLVILGIILAALAYNFEFFEPLRQFTLTPQLILYILLPTLIFEASLNIDSRLLIKNIVPVLMLAAPGLVISTFIVGIMVKFMTPLGLGGAMLFGALISATDPVAVITLFKDVGAPKRLTMLVDGESLFNDATAIVMFNIVMGMIVSGAAFSMGTFFKGSCDFALIFLGGVFIGALIGCIMIQIMKFTKDDPMLELAFSVIAAYTSFIVADRCFGVSGVMSSMGAGIVFSWYGTTRFTAEVREYLKKFWEFAVFVANTFIFLLLGLTEKVMFFDIGKSKGIFLYILFAIIAVLVSRIVVVFGLCPLIGMMKNQKKISIQYQTVLFWGGLRGGVPLALVLSIPVSFANRDMLIGLTLGIVLFTLLIQGTSMNFLIRLLKLDKPGTFEKMLSLQAVISSKRKVMEVISNLEKTGHFSDDTVSVVRDKYAAEILDSLKELEDLRDNPENASTVRQIIWSETLNVKRNTYHGLFDRGIIQETVFRELEHSLNSQQESITANNIPPKVIIELIPPEVKFEKFILKLLKLVFPEGKLLRLHYAKALIINLEEAIALVIAVKDINALLDDVSRLYREHSVALNECRDFYKDVHDKSIAHIEKIEKSYPEYADQVKTRVLRQVGFDTELKTMKEMVEKGKLPESVCSEMEAEYERKIIENRKAV